MLLPDCRRHLKRYRESGTGFYTSVSVPDSFVLGVVARDLGLCEIATVMKAQISAHGHITLSEVNLADCMV